MFIVEGPDCAGKSTLCSLLSSVLKLDIIHLNNKSDNSFHTYLSRIVEMEKRPVIYDRFFFSEAVYSEALCRKRTFKDFEYSLLKSQVIKSNVQVIHCTQQPRVLLQRAADRGEDFVNSLELVTIADLFHKHLFGFPVLTVEPNIFNIELFRSSLEAHIDSIYELKNTNE